MKQHDKHVEEEGTCFRVGQQVMCRPSLPVTNKSLTMETPTGPKRRHIYASLSQPMCVCVCGVCVGVCGKQQLLMPFYNSLFSFSVFRFSFHFTEPLSHNFAIMLFVTLFSFFFTTRPDFKLLQKLRNVEFFSFLLLFFFLFQPRLGQTRRDQLVFTLP